jgi:hypothetical protein
MQGGGFGRKGLADGAAMPQRQAFPAQRAQAADPEIAAKRAAFLAAERARSAELANTVAPEPEDEGIGYSKHADRLMEQSGFRQVGKAKSMAFAYLWWFILGQVSAHRFYLGHKESAFRQLGVFVISMVLILLPRPIGYLGIAVFFVWLLWIIADVFLIPGLCRRANQELTAPARIFD